MKKSNKIFASLLVAPLLATSVSAFAAKPNKKEWTAISDTQAQVLATNVKNSKGLFVDCYPGQNKMDISIHDMTAGRGIVVRYWTDKGKQGDFITKSKGIVSSADNDPQVMQKFISDIAHDYSITFQVGDKFDDKVTYSLVGSADTLRSLQGCGLAKPRGPVMPG